MASKSPPPPPFVIFALPRSRTAWMASYLSHRQCNVGHDITIECKHPEDFFADFAPSGPMLGTVETGAVMAWKLIRQRLPEAKFVVVRRPLGDVKASLGQFGLEAPPGELEARDEMLDVVASLPGSESLRYSDLCIPQVCRWLFEHCLERPWDPSWHAMMAQINVQVNMTQRIEQLLRNHEDLVKLQAEMLGAIRGIAGGSPCLGLN
jgi:hypothetical protein